MEPQSPHAPKEKEGEVERNESVPDDADENEKEREEEWMEWNPLTHPDRLKAKMVIQ